jgi:argininosuccinate lyase
MAQVNPKTNILRTEPAVVISTVTAVLTALITLSLAFGLDISKERQDAILAAVSPVVAVIFLMGPIIRTFVFSPATTEKLVQSATQ